MVKKRKPPTPMKTARNLQLVPAPESPSLVSLGINEGEVDELRELIRSMNQRRQKHKHPIDDTDLPPAA